MRLSRCRHRGVLAATVVALLVPSACTSTEADPPSSVIAEETVSPVAVASSTPSPATPATPGPSSSRASVPVLGPGVEGDGWTTAFPQGWVVSGGDAMAPVAGGTARLRVTSEPAEEARPVAAGVQLDVLGLLAATDYQLEGEGPVELPAGGEEIRYAAVLPDRTPLRFRTVAVARDGTGVAVTLSAPASAFDDLVVVQDAVLERLEIVAGSD